MRKRVVLARIVLLTIKYKFFVQVQFFDGASEGNKSDLTLEDPSE